MTRDTKEGTKWETNEREGVKSKESQPKSEKRERVREFRFSTFCFYCYGIFEIVIHRVIITYEATKFIFCSFFLSVLAVFYINSYICFVVLFVSMFYFCLPYTFFPYFSPLSRSLIKLLLLFFLCFVRWFSRLLLHLHFPFIKQVGLAKTNNYNLTITYFVDFFFFIFFFLRVCDFLFP